MKDIIAQRQGYVVKANKFIQQSRYNLTMQQQRILLYLIAQIQPDQTEFQETELSIIDFCELCGIGGKNYADIKAAVKSLADCSFWMEYEDKSKLVRWIASYPAPVVEKNSGIIRLKLSDSLRDYLLQLRERFTVYELQWVLAFRHRYSIRLYEYVCSRHYDGMKPYTFAVPVDELMAIMGATAYKRFADFHCKCLAPSVAEIDTMTDKSLSYELKKRGKTVTAIQFTISTQPDFERIRRDSDIQHRLGIDPDQQTLWDEMTEKGYV